MSAFHKLIKSVHMNHNIGAAAGAGATAAATTEASYVVLEVTILIFLADCVRLRLTLGRRLLLLC